MKDNKLRDQRLVYYKEDLDQIDKLVAEFLKLSNARCLFLIDKEGHSITSSGSTQEIDPETISALVAGSFAATKELARTLGEAEFSVMFHQGKTDNIHVSLIGDRAITAIVFDEENNRGHDKSVFKRTYQQAGENI